MTWTAQVWHVLQKDVHEHRRLLAVYLGIIIVAITNANSGRLAGASGNFANAYPASEQSTRCETTEMAAPAFIPPIVPPLEEITFRDPDPLAPSKRRINAPEIGLVLNWDFASRALNSTTSVQAVAPAPPLPAFG